MRNDYIVRPQDLIEFEDVLTDLNNRATSQPSGRGGVVVRVIKSHNRSNPVGIVVEEQKDETNMAPKKKLTIDEKLQLLNKIAGKAKHYDAETIKESDRIARREDWKDEAE
ncbi:hypothetical protein [Fictibacillus fluitans]|uniref:Uncharacterized protein n=1 Tax=Fictibacillus fluitans TaxID=3058422 RepID=A0ABT8HT62_9BACL|nr:hypothetical protein [Fictibacillus sp. NE201]MDN4523936.1 hypothetical protein [Fictibacillus sp. NE201]